MKIFFVLLSFTFSLFGAKILSYNVYDRSDRVDIMFTFDTPFEGEIRQTTQDEKIVIKLKNSTIESAKIKNINSPFLTKLTILPLQNETQIVAKVPSNITFVASKTSDAYGLRLRFQKKVLTILETQQTKNSVSVLPLPTKEETQISASYIAVIFVLLGLLAILLIVKRRLNIPSNSKQNSNIPWLFNKKNDKEGVTIRFQKAVDTKNRVVMLEYGDSSYLLLVGSSNVILDKFHNNEVVKTENDFENILKDKNSELDEFLQIDRNTKESDGLNRYKENASII
jgi:hypothetical protein